MPNGLMKIVRLPLVSPPYIDVAVSMSVISSYTDWLVPLTIAPARRVSVLRTSP